jgi:hypothetical protein
VDETAFSGDMEGILSSEYAMVRWKLSEAAVAE